MKFKLTLNNLSITCKDSCHIFILKLDSIINVCSRYRVKSTKNLQLLITYLKHLPIFNSKVKKGFTFVAKLGFKVLSNIRPQDIIFLERSDVLGRDHRGTYIVGYSMVGTITITASTCLSAPPPTPLNLGTEPELSRLGGVA